MCIPARRLGRLAVHPAGGGGYTCFRGHLKVAPRPHDDGEPFKKTADVERLGDVIGRARPDQPHRLINATLTGDEQEWRRRPIAGECVIQLLSRAVRQADIADHRVDGLARCADRGQGAGDLAVPLNLGPLQRQPLHQRRAHDLVILDQHDAAPRDHACTRAGRSTRMIVAPSLRVWVIRPFRPTTMSWASRRPTPPPGGKGPDDNSRAR